MTVVADALKRPPLASIRDCWVPATEAVLDSEQSKIGASLPADYREFLMSRNGGSLDLPNCISTLEPWDGLRKFSGPAALHSIGCSDSLRYRDVLVATQWDADYLPPGALSIGTAGENVFCIHPSTGRVGFIDRDKEPGSGDILVSHSFSGFLSSITVDLDELRAENKPGTPEYFIASHDCDSLREWIKSLKTGLSVERAVRLFEFACVKSHRVSVEELLNWIPETRAPELLDVADAMQFADAYLIVASRMRLSNSSRIPRSEYIQTFIDRFGDGLTDRYPLLT